MDIESFMAYHILGFIEMQHHCVSAPDGWNESVTFSRWIKNDFTHSWGSPSKASWGKTANKKIKTHWRQLP